MFSESHPIIVLVLKPQGIDSFLNDRMTISMERIPRILFLRAHGNQRAPNSNAMGANTINECHLRQQLFCVRYIVAYALGCLIPVKFILGRHGAPQFSPHFRDEGHAINCELEDHMKQSYMTSRYKRGSPVQLGLRGQGMSPPSQTPRTTQSPPIRPSC